MPCTASRITSPVESLRVISSLLTVASGSSTNSQVPSFQARTRVNSSWTCRAIAFSRPSWSKASSSRSAWPSRFFSRITISVALTRLSLLSRRSRTSISPRRSSVTLVVALTRWPRWKRTL